MYRVATIAAYDVMETVHITCSVRLWDGLVTDGSDVEFHCDATVQGVGSADGREWLRDALVGLIESI